MTVDFVLDPLNLESDISILEVESRVVNNGDRRPAVYRMPQERYDGRRLVVARNGRGDRHRVSRWGMAPASRTA